MDMYQEYLYVVGKLKDVHGLEITVEHENVHTFYKNKKPVFKLLFGMHDKEEDTSIAVTFHIDLMHAEAIQWFIAIYNTHPPIRLQDSYIEDSDGNFFLGEDAIKIQYVYTSQDVLKEWLENATKEEIKEFTETKVTGYVEKTQKTFDSQNQREMAKISFNQLRKPTDDEEVH